MRHCKQKNTIEFWGYKLKRLKPFDGYMTMHTTDGKCHEEHRKQGKLAKAENEQWDYRGAKSLELPNRSIKTTSWIGEQIDTRGRRYEGEFKDGLCHGHGVFTYPKGGFTQDGEWIEGMFSGSRKA